MAVELTETRNGERRVQDGQTYSYAEPSLGSLFTSLTNDVSSLIRQELQLARTETMEKVSGATRNVGMIVAGGMVAYVGVITLVIAVVIGLGAIVPYWLSALIIGALIVITGLMLLQAGRSGFSQMSIVPKKTIQSLQEDAEFVKEKVS